MIDLMRSEWIKFRSVRSTLIVLALAGVLVVLVAVLAANNLSDDTTSACQSAGQTVSDPGFSTCPEGQVRVEVPKVVNLTDVTVGVSIAVLLFGVLGVQVIGQEYRFNTIRPTFTAVPHRMKVMVAKLIVVCTANAVVAALMVLVSWAVGSLMVEDLQIDGVDQRAALGIVLFTIGWTMLGMGVGAVLRQPIAAIPLLLGEAFIAESIIGALVNSTLKWLPFTNGFQMTFRDTGGDGSSATELQTVLAGGIYFFVVAAAVWGLGAFLVNKRDA